MGALVGSASVDRLGRRRQLIIGTSVCAVLLYVCSGLFSHTGSSERANAGITFIFLFMVVFSFGYTAIQA